MDDLPFTGTLTVFSGRYEAHVSLVIVSAEREKKQVSFCFSLSHDHRAFTNTDLWDDLIFASPLEKLNVSKVKSNHTVGRVAAVVEQACMV
jgi:hypothetical protein